MKKGSTIIATRPILYEGRQFMTGEALPAYDKEMVDAWIKSGSAKKVEEAPNKKPVQGVEEQEEELKAEQEPEAEQKTTRRKKN